MSARSYRYWLYWTFASLLLAGCSTPQLTEQPNTLYCDRFMIYEMCALDLTHNGEVDMLYFADTLETFMYWEDTSALIPSDYPYHECVQPGDEEIRKLGSRLLHIEEDTHGMQVSNIKTRLLLSYTRYMPEVKRCNNPEWAEADGDQFTSDFDGKF